MGCLQIGSLFKIPPAELLVIHDDIDGLETDIQIGRDEFAAMFAAGNDAPCQVDRALDERGAGHARHGAAQSFFYRGAEVAPHNVQVNAIAQNFVDNPTYFPPEVQANPRFQERLKREVPLGTLATSEKKAGQAAVEAVDKLEFPGVPKQAVRDVRLADSLDKLKELDKLKSNFLATVSHELRTPLTSIRALAEVMRDDAEMPAEQRQEFLAIVVAETERLTRLVNQVLDIAKIESGHAEWHNTDVDLHFAAELRAWSFAGGAAVALGRGRCASSRGRSSSPSSSWPFIAFCQ